MPRPRKLAGTPIGGQFAQTNRPSATLALVDNDTDENGPSGAIVDALLELERDGARQADRYKAVGRIVTCLTASARDMVGDKARAGPDWSSRSTRLGRLEELADAALLRAAGQSGLDDEAHSRLIRGVSSQMSTDLWRAALHHVRARVATVATGSASPSDDQVRDAQSAPGPVSEPQAAPGAGQSSWVCPADAPHATVGRRCTTCGVTRIANAGPSESVPPFDPHDGETVVARRVTSEPGNRIRLDSIDWTVCGDPDEEGGERAQMLGTVVIGSTPLHCLALEVRDDASRIQRALQRGDDLGDDLGDAARALSDDGPYEAVEIDGRSYALFLSPHAR